MNYNGRIPSDEFQRTIDTDEILTDEIPTND